MSLINLLIVFLVGYLVFLLADFGLRRFPRLSGEASTLAAIAAVAGMLVYLGVIPL